MKRKIVFMIAALLGMLTVYGQPKPIPGQYIVLLKESSAKPIIKNQRQNINREQKVLDNKLMRDKNILKLKDVQNKRSIKQSSVLAEFGDVAVGFSAKLDNAEFKRLKEDPDVEGVFQDYMVSLGPIVPEKDPPDLVQIDLKSGTENIIISGPYADFYLPVIDNTFVDHGFMPAQYVSCAIIKAGGFIDGSAKTKWIWILDTGINMNHPDLNVQTNPTFAKSFVPGQTVEDGYGHGTHCAGIAAAKNNTFGVVGVSAGAKVVPVKVLNNAGSGSFSWLISGLNHVAMHDIPGDVINMSLGGYGWANCENAMPPLRDIIRSLGNAGTYVCMAAGNDNANAAMNLPGCVNGNRVYTVGCISCTNQCCSFSNFGANVVDWVAVGYGVYSTFKNGGYATLSGTSMSTPVVAGIIHARNGPPIPAGVVNCKGVNYKIAHR